AYLHGVTIEVQSMLFGGSAVLAALVSDGAVDWPALAARLRSGLDRAVAASDGRRRRSPVTARNAAPVAAAAPGGAVDR
ncbi:MAG TPA: hypothetical protein VHL53_17920, partial [Acidimicrobiia bacterium]|nr:hypothetical protein [Acidimicrobiia bacterium]